MVPIDPSQKNLDEYFTKIHPSEKKRFAWFQQRLIIVKGKDGKETLTYKWLNIFERLGALFNGRASFAKVVQFCNTHKLVNNDLSTLVGLYKQKHPDQSLTYFCELESNQPTNVLTATITLEKTDQQERYITDIYNIKCNGQVIGHARLFPDPVVASAKPGEKFYCLYNITINPEFRGKGLGRKAFEKICNDYIDKGYSIYLNEITLGGVGPHLYGGEKTRNVFDVSVATRNEGSWYILRKKSGDTKPLEHLRISEDEFYILLSLFNNSGSEYDKINSCGLRSLITYLEHFPEDAKKLQKILPPQSIENDLVLYSITDEKLREERISLRNEAWNLIYPPIH